MDEQYLQYRLTKKAEHRPFDFDSYVSQISQNTFTSTVVPIDPACARAMVSYYQQRFNNRNGALLHDGVSRLENLRGTIASAIAREFGGGAIFCRMTNRSPKDGEPRNREKLARLYERELSELERRKERQEGAVWNRANLQMVAASAAQLRMLHCENADEVMDLLLSSERVFMDTMLALDCFSNDADEWSTCLILREWNEGVRGDWEFRGFVHEGCLTAISQYNHYCIFPDLLEIDECCLRSEIVEYWETVRDCITATSYIIDLVKLSDGTWKVIELNPYASTTGAALFDWDADRTILSASSREPELRIRQEPCEGLEEYVQYVILPTFSLVSEENKPADSGPWDDFLTVCSNYENTENVPQIRAPSSLSKIHCIIH